MDLRNQIINLIIEILPNSSSSKGTSKDINRAALNLLGKIKSLYNVDVAILSIFSRDSEYLSKKQTYCSGVTFDQIPKIRFTEDGLTSKAVNGKKAVFYKDHKKVLLDMKVTLKQTTS